MIFGTGNCTTQPGGGPFSDAMVAARPRRPARCAGRTSRTRPNRDDLDFAGAPNLFDVDGRALVGLGNKDGVYYIVDRDDRRARVRPSHATEPGLTARAATSRPAGSSGRPRTPTAIVVGGTAVGPAPVPARLDVATGAIRWQNQEPAPTYARDRDRRRRRVRRRHRLHPARASTVDDRRGAVVAPDEGRGVRRRRDRRATTCSRSPASASPALDKRSRRAACTASRSRGKTAKIRIRRADAHPSTPPTRPRPRRSASASPCELGFELKQPPRRAQPHRRRSRSRERPVPAPRAGRRSRRPRRGWLRPGTRPRPRARPPTPCSSPRATTTRPAGSCACSTPTFDCTGDQRPARGATYNRVSIVAVKDARSDADARRRLRPARHHHVVRSRPLQPAGK